MGDLTVVGLAGRHPNDAWAPLLAGRTIVARRMEPAIRAMPAEFEIHAAFDDILDSVPPGDAPGQVVDALIDLARERAVVYVTSGFAVAGDAIVERLRSRASARIQAGYFSNDLCASGTLTIVDVLTLAAAERDEPFVGNIPALDPTMTTLLTNVDTSEITKLALERTSRIYPETTVPMRIDRDTLVLSASDPLAARGSVAALEFVVARLRRADGCPWDREQTPKSLLPALAEEAEELRMAIEAGDAENAIEEIGDVFVNLLMQAQMAAESGTFRFADAVDAARAKLVRRHPHVFDNKHASTPEEVLKIWHEVKASEKAARRREAGATTHADEHGTGNA